jgi:rRNA-processing protein FCF1
MILWLFLEILIKKAPFSSCMETREILLDTNFCLNPFRLGIDIFKEIQRICDFKYILLIPEEVARELLYLAQSNSKTGRYAKAALALLENKKVKLAKSKKVINTSSLQHLDESRKDGDIAIIEYAQSHPDVIIATDDKLLKKRLSGFKLISTRQKQYLILGER